MVKGDIAIESGNIKEAIQFYEEILDLHFDDITGDDALYKLALIYDEQLGDLQKAEELYSKLLFDFSGSLYTVQARKRFRELTDTLPE